jgi:hypothetical protein
MKTTRSLFYVSVLIAMSTYAFGAPFLVSDPYPKEDVNLKHFLVTIIGKTRESVPARNADGTFYLNYDLGDLPDGTYTATIRAVDTKGKESGPATYSFKKNGTKVEPYNPPVPKQKIAPSRSYPGHSTR